jgi:hypothetical protein
LIKILKIIDLLDWGGAQKMQVFLAEQLNAHDVELTVVSLNASAGSPVLEFLRQHGARVVIFPFPKFLSFRSFWGLFNFIAGAGWGTRAHPKEFQPRRVNAAVGIGACLHVPVWGYHNRIWS